jgi:hypothetical protein
LFNIWVKTINEIREEFWYMPFEDENTNRNILKSWYVYLEDLWIDQMPIDLSNNKPT